MPLSYSFNSAKKEYMCAELYLDISNPYLLKFYIWIWIIELLSIIVCISLYAEEGVIQ